MPNAKEEFIARTKWLTVKCAKVYFEEYDYDNRERVCNYIDLKVWFTPEEQAEFIKKLDKEYDGWYWSQQLFWYVRFEDGTWLERWEYDGSERWEHKKCPEIPEDLLPH